MLNKAKTFPLQFGSGELKKTHRLRLEAEFNYVKQAGIKYVGRYFILVAAESSEDLKYGVICSRKFSKNAVVRNRARRLLRESFRLIKNRIANVHMVFIPRHKIKQQQLQEVQSEMIVLLKKAGLWIE